MPSSTNLLTYGSLIVALILVPIAACIAIFGDIARFGVLAAFIISLLIFSSLARFKKFKGFGIEAELWEQKQEEAADLVDSMRSLLGVIVRESLHAKVMGGRFGGGEHDRWKKTWDSFDAIYKNEHLVDKNEMKSIKKELFIYFIFDAVGSFYSEVHGDILGMENKFQFYVQDKYGKTIKDLEGHRRDLQKLTEIKQLNPGEPIELARERRLARSMLDWIQETKERYKDHFDLDLHVHPGHIKDLELIASLENSDPVVHPRLLELADTRV